MSSSESEIEDNESNQQSEQEEIGNEEEILESTTTNGNDSDKPVTWNDLVREYCLNSLQVTNNLIKYQFFRA